MKELFENGDFLLSFLLVSIVAICVIAALVWYIVGQTQDSAQLTQILTACQQVSDSAADLKKCVESLK